MSRTIIDVYALHTVPPSNLNRDDTGSPKTAIYGGVTRARVSSQAWKRPTREAFRATTTPDRLGIRTKRVLEVLSARIRGADAAIEQERSVELAAWVLGTLGIKLTKPRAKKDEAPKLDEAGYLVFLSNRQFDTLAAVAVEANASDDASAAITARKKELRTLAQSENSIDVSLFGRMVADDTDLNVDAAAQVAHAISVHEVSAEADFFTAVDDTKAVDDDETDSGAAMLGVVEFNSSTLYRYATVDANRLLDNLGQVDATAAAVAAFVQGFVTSVPTGKQNTFAHRTLPELVVVSVRDTQPVNLVGAFEKAVTGRDRVADATSALTRRANEIDTAYGTTPVRSWVVRVGEETAAAATLGASVSLSELVSELGEVVTERLGS